MTWEAATPSAAADIKDRVAAVLSFRLAGRRVAEVMELLYASARYTLSERLEMPLRPSRNPYRARLGQLHGDPWEGHITCGHNPFLEARLVESLRVEVDADGEERLTWTERRQGLSHRLLNLVE